MATLELNHLTEAERDLILSVVRRDEELQKKEQTRIENLKADIKLVKMKGALKPGMNAEKSCARCRKSFGWLFDKGEICPKCEQKVCAECCLQMKETNKLMCVLCQKQKELDAMSGAWFYSKFVKSKRSRKTNQFISGTDLVRSSFKKRSHAEMSESTAAYEVNQSLRSRKHGSSPEADGESSDTQSMEAQSPRTSKKTDFTDAAYPKDAEKIMLLDLIGGPSVPSFQQQLQQQQQQGPAVSVEPIVHVHRINTHRFSDSSSEGASVPSSPQFSHRTESEYPASESINSSFRSTSAMSSDGQYTMVTDNNSVISGISTAPPSMQQSPKLNYKNGAFHNSRDSARKQTANDTGVAKRLSAHSTSKESLHTAHSGGGSMTKQTVKVSSRGRVVSSSSSEGEDGVSQQSKLCTAGVVVHASYSSGSESSRTPRERCAQNSDAQSQHSGSLSGADTGSTLDAPVLEPPSEFITPEDNMDGNSTNSGVNMSSEAATGVQQLASVRQKVNALLAKHGIADTKRRDGATDSIHSSVDQNVHRLSHDDYDVIDSPPLHKKARLIDNTNYYFDSDADPDSPHSSFDNLQHDHVNNNIDDMEWDTHDFQEATKPKILSSTREKVAAFESQQKQSSQSHLTFDNRNTQKIIHPHQNVSGGNIGIFVKPSAKEYVIIPGDDSDEYSDSLSVITEHTEPDGTDTEQEYDSDRTLSPLGSYKDGEESDIDFDEMFQCNKSILQLHETDMLFRPIVKQEQVTTQQQLAISRNEKLCYSSKPPQTAKGGQSSLSDAPVQKHPHKNEPLHVKAEKCGDKSAKGKSSVLTFREAHEINCEKYECISVSPLRAEDKSGAKMFLDERQTRRDTDHSRRQHTKQTSHKVEVIDESHLKSVLDLQNLFNSKSPVRKPRFSEEFSESDKEIDSYLNKGHPLQTAGDEPTVKDKVQPEKLLKGKCRSPVISDSIISPLADSLVDTALFDAFSLVDNMSVMKQEKDKNSLISHTEEEVYKRPRENVVLDSQKPDSKIKSKIFSPMYCSDITNESKSQGEHFVKEKSPVDSSSPVMKKKKKKLHFKSQGIVHPAFTSKSYLKQHDKSPSHSNVSSAYSDDSHSDFLCSTPTPKPSASRIVESPKSAHLFSPGATSQGSLGLSKATSPEVDQALPSDLSSVQDQSSDMSAHMTTQDSSQRSFTGSVPSISVTDKSQAELEAREEDDNIDDLVDSYKTRPHARSHSNLMSPFSSSVESVASIYSEAGEGNYGKIPITGEIQFGLDYNYQTNVLEVHVKQCKDIAAVDTKRKRSDPYVKTYLLPDRTKSGKKKTRVRKHTINPVFNEIIKYHIGKSEMATRTLWLTVWHNDSFGRNDFLGEVTIPLDYYEFKDRTPKWYSLQERAPLQTSLLTYKGDLNVSLKYVTAENVSSKKVKGKSGNKGELLVLVKQARNLTAVRSSGTSDPFCKGYLLPEKGKGGKQKSPVIKKNCNPQWNHTFVFEDIGWEELRERTLELTIWDHDRFTSNDFLGGVRLGLGTGCSFNSEVDWSDSRGEEISVWQSMLDRPNTWIEVTLLLRPNMNSRSPP